MSITIQMSRQEAERMGLLICKCGWPKNNHFNFTPYRCAHTKACTGYKEISRVGKLKKGK